MNRFAFLCNTPRANERLVLKIKFPARELLFSAQGLIY